MDATWLQYWAYLPAIAEEQMNDGTGPPGQPSISESTTHHHLARADTQFEVNSLSSANALAYPSRGYVRSASSFPQGGAAAASSLPISSSSSSSSSSWQQARHPSQALPANPSGQASSYAVVSSVRQSTAAYAVSEHQRRGLTLFPMAAMTETIPEYRTQSIAPFAQQQRVPSGMSTPSFFYQIQQLPQFAGQTGFNHSGHPGWIPMQYPSPYPAPYPQNDPLSPADPSAQGFSPHMQPPSAPFAGVGLAQYPLAGHAWHILQHQQMYPYYSQVGGYGPMRRGRSSGRHPSPSSRSSNLPSTESLARQQHVGLGVGAPGQVLGGLEPESAGRAGAPPIVSGNPVGKRSTRSCPYHLRCPQTTRCRLFWPVQFLRYSCRQLHMLTTSGQRAQETPVRLWPMLLHREVRPGNPSSRATPSGLGIYLRRRTSSSSRTTSRGRRRTTSRACSSSRRAIAPLSTTRPKRRARPR